MLNLFKPNIESIVAPLNNIIRELESAMEWYAKESVKQKEIAEKALKTQLTCTEEIDRAIKISEKIKALVA